MAQIAQDVQNNAPRDPLAPAAATILSSYTEALDTVRAHALWHPIYMDTYQLSVSTMLGPTCRDLPGYCGVIEKAERGTDALKEERYCLSYFRAVFVRFFLRPGVVYQIIGPLLNFSLL